MVELIQHFQVPLAITAAIGFATGLWMFRARTQGDGEQ